jgi:16S rRNA processing protein RimM
MQQNIMEIGFVNNVRGLKGELKATHFCDYKEIYEELPFVIIDNNKFEIEYIKYHKNQIILKLFNINTIYEAESLKNKKIYSPRENLPPLLEGKFYIVDLIGIEVYLKDGSLIGKITDVIQNGPNDIYEIKDENNKTVLIPAVKEFIAETDIKNKKIVITPIEGLI